MVTRLSQIFKRERAEITDARRVYAALMAQSRKPEFYGAGAIPDSYDGRIDFLTLHIAVIFSALKAHGETGVKLSQALYDVMIDDFDVALREEGLSDTGVVRRIKPMASLFFERIKAYSEALVEDKPRLSQTIQSGYKPDISPANLTAITDYTWAYKENVSAKSLGELAQANFEFPLYSAVSG